MNLFPVSVTLLFLCFTEGSIYPSQFAGDFSINCGSTGASAARNGRQWVGDVQPKLSSSSLQLNGLSAASTAIRNSKLTSSDPVPHKTARLSRTQFSYVFQLNPGQKILRLHFYPVLYRGFKGSKDLFSVEAGPFTLLSNFSASITASALGVESLTKEIVLTIQENQPLTLTFSPESSGSLSHAFINGIEFIPVPARLSYFGGGESGLQVVGQKSMVYVDSSTALEIVHRQYIKEDLVPPTGDFDGMFPKWATRRADKMKHITWKMPVEVGFRYLIRLHFSEVASTGDAVFRVLINEMVAELAKEKEENNIVLYRDYLVAMRGHKQDGKRDILISIGPSDGHDVLAGFEILKLSNPDDNLASPNPLPLLQDSSSPTIQILLWILTHRNASGTVVVTLISLLNILVYKLREIWEARSTEEEHKPSARAERICRRFPLAEIQLATRNFSDGQVIGRGGFGKVYKGLIDKGQTTVAVKRLKSNSQQGAREFLTEVETLSELRHINLVSLIGFCNAQREMILVYEYMPCGTVADHLYKYARDNSDHSPLTWKQRLNICIGAARGLDYLHTGHGVIHRDVKASNILLDESFIAKVSDFGLAKHENKGKLQSHVSTKVKGTNGYLDPHYLHTGKLTRKSDTYAFGVVLLETLCGRPAVDLWAAEDEQILTKWARDKIGKGEVCQIVASSLKEEISSNSLKAFVDIAEKCLRDEPKNRPTMSQVVLQLEFALEEQDNILNQEMNPPASAFVDPHPTYNHETNTYMQNHALPTNKQIQTKVLNDKLTTGRKYGRTSASNNPSRFSPWDAFCYRVKLSKKNELALSDTTKMEARKEEESWKALSSFQDKVKLREFDRDTIADACNQFSSSNKVGVGGSGSVYKAVLPSGELVAVKRLSKSSYMDIDEIYNEVFLLPSLQHPNIIKLLGHCRHSSDTLLVYEFMENASSLDTFIDKENGSLLWLLWPLRFKIITGIARGLAYLHSERRVIHRDLKLSNILLDSEMNPKISHFGDARSLEGGHQSGYEIYCNMRPECPRKGTFSAKPDVYSFGIIVLSVLTGTRASTPEYLEHNKMTLRNYALTLWNEGKAIYLVDKSLGAFSADEALRCIRAALLCTQLDSDQRPEMPYVLKLLDGGDLPQ